MGMVLQMPSDCLSACNLWTLENHTRSHDKASALPGIQRLLIGVTVDTMVPCLSFGDCMGGGGVSSTT